MFTKKCVYDFIQISWRWEMLQNDHRFSIAFESSPHAYYVTEKIVNSFLAGTIPIYWGNVDINTYFNPRSFINVASFSSFEGYSAACTSHLWSHQPSFCLLHHVSPNLRLHAPTVTAAWLYYSDCLVMYVTTWADAADHVLGKRNSQSLSEYCLSYWSSLSASFTFRFTFHINTDSCLGICTAVDRNETLAQQYLQEPPCTDKNLRTLFWWRYT